MSEKVKKAKKVDQPSGQEDGSEFTPPRKTKSLVPVSQSPESLISQAINKGVSVETMERLLVMRRELKEEKAKELYNESMAAFQADCPTIVKTKEVKTRAGIVAYRYAPIESIVEQVKPYLQKHGFSYSSNMELLESGVKVKIRVTHEAGHSETNEMSVPLGNKTDIMSASQVVAAAQTFAKRYAFCNAFGILTGDEDNDTRLEEEAHETETPVLGQVRAPKGVSPKTPQETARDNDEGLPSLPSESEGLMDPTRKDSVTVKQNRMLRRLMSETGKSEVQIHAWTQKFFKVDSLTKLTRDQASRLIDAMMKLPKVKLSLGEEDGVPVINLDE